MAEGRGGCESIICLEKADNVSLWNSYISLIDGLI